MIKVRFNWRPLIFSENKIRDPIYLPKLYTKIKISCLKKGTSLHRDRDFLFSIGKKKGEKNESAEIEASGPTNGAGHPSHPITCLSS